MKNLLAALFLATSAAASTATNPNALTAISLANAPAQCGAGFPSGIDIYGNALNCQVPSGGITALTGGVTASGPGSAVATVVTNANQTGDVTSVGNATTAAAVQPNILNLSGLTTISHSFTVPAGDTVTFAGGGMSSGTFTFDGKVAFSTYTETIALQPNSGTAFTVYWSSGSVSSQTLTGNVTYAFANAAAGQSITLLLTQDSTGSRTITWPTVRWAGGTAPTLTTTPGKTDIISFFYSGTDYFGFTGGLGY